MPHRWLGNAGEVFHTHRTVTFTICAHARLQLLFQRFCHWDPFYSDAAMYINASNLHQKVLSVLVPHVLTYFARRLVTGFPRRNPKGTKYSAIYLPAPTAPLKKISFKGISSDRMVFDRSAGFGHQARRIDALFPSLNPAQPGERPVKRVKH